MVFDVEKTAVYKSVKKQKSPIFIFSPFLKKAFLFLSLALFVFFLFGLFTQAVETKLLSLVLGFCLVFFSFFLAEWQKIIFLEEKIKKPELPFSLKEAVSSPESYNLAELLDFEAAKVILKAKENSNDVLLKIASFKNRFDFVFLRLLIDKKPFVKGLKKEMKEEEPPEVFQKTIFGALKNAVENNHNRITVGDLLISLAGSNPFFSSFLVGKELKKEDVENLILWRESIAKKLEEKKKFWKKRNLFKIGTLAKEWSAGYTVALDKFSRDLTREVRAAGFPEIIGHKEEILAAERILARGEINNVLLVGEAGTGKKTIAKALASKTFLGESFAELNYSRVMALDVPSVLSFAKGSEEACDVLDKIFREVISAGNIILVIDNIHQFCKTETQEGEIDISGVISPYLEYPSFRVVANSTYQGLHKHIERKPSFLGNLEKVEIEELSKEETLKYLQRISISYEERHKKLISYPALREAIALSDRYLPDLPFPKKAVGLLDEVMVYAGSMKEKIITPEHVAKIVSEKAQIPVGKIKEEEKEILLNLESLIHQRIINQEKAVEEAATALRRARSEITVRKGPMGTFLFMGPTGVGKTETSKALAEIYFGSESRMLRFDMSEFQNVSDISRLIGSQNEDGVLSTQVRENPFSLILLDEIEKAHKNILNLFLQVLDEGFLKDGLGREVNFRNSIIIATSNAGYQIILKALEEKTGWEKIKEEILDYVFDKGVFRPEFINRFDGVIVFSPLSKENLLDIAGLMLKKLQKNLKEKGINLIITPSLKEKIVQIGYNPTFGAREMRRAIQNNIENVLASALLSGEIKRGQRVEINPSDFSLKVQ